MATWNNETQFGPTPVVAGTLKEEGYYQLTSSEVDGASISVPTKLRKVKGGIGITSDGLPCFAVAAMTSNGLAVFTRCGPATDETPILYYTLYGV